jgi:hypothetical protein
MTFPLAPPASPVAGPAAAQGVPPQVAPLPAMPAALGAPPRIPSSAPPPLAQHVTPDTPDEKMPREPKLDDLKNLFDRRGLLLAQGVEEQGKRVAEAMQQPPTNSVKLTPGQIRDYWRFSPNGMDDAANNDKFWEIHDQVLAQTGDPALAEKQAMQQVFPYRGTLAQLGIASAERQVEMAEHLRGVVDGTLKPPSNVVSVQHHAMNEQVQQVQGGMG